MLPIQILITSASLILIRPRKYAKQAPSADCRGNLFAALTYTGIIVDNQVAALFNGVEYKNSSDLLST
jgi:hypothetical protein